MGKLILFPFYEEIVWELHPILWYGKGLKSSAKIFGKIKDIIK